MELGQLDSFADSLFRERPPWTAEGSLGNDDTRFLLRTAFQARANLAVEIGTASGFSTLVLCHALQFANTSGMIGSDFQIISYDISTTFYRDSTKNVGDAARAGLPEKLLEHIVFRNPATAADLHKFHSADSIPFLFLDADHRHPLPTIDLLHVLPFLAPRATVVLHDINLPLIQPTRLDYAFVVTRTSAGEPVEFWDGVDSERYYFSTDLTGTDAGETANASEEFGIRRFKNETQSGEWSEIEINSTSSKEPGDGREQTVFQVRIRYRNRAASKVCLVWGLNEFTQVPKNVPPETFFTYGGSHMNTRMKKEGDVFVTEFEIESTTRPDWGVKHLFDGLELPKNVAADRSVSNIGSFVVPEDKERLEEQLRRILFAHEWQTMASNSDLQALGLNVN